jgi:hypothetical protein
VALQDGFQSWEPLTIAKCERFGRTGKMLYKKRTRTSWWSVTAVQPVFTLIKMRARKDSFSIKKKKVALFRNELLISNASATTEKFF